MHDPSIAEKAKHLFKRIPVLLTKGVATTAVDKIGAFFENYSNDSEEFPDKTTSLPNQAAIQKAVELSDTSQ